MASEHDLVTYGDLSGQLVPVDVVVGPGGGVIGMAIGWRAALGGLSVIIVDPDSGR